MAKLFSVFLLFVVMSAAAVNALPVYGRPAASQVVIGSGTAASCQTQNAANAFSNAVAAGGVIDFDCGDQPVIITVNTSVTDQEVTVNGDSRIILSGEDLRQLFLVTGSGSLTLNDLSLQDGDAGQGGAIWIDTQASVTINRSFLVSNNAASVGVAVYNKGTLTIQDSTLGSNIAGTNCGGIFNDDGSVMILDSYLISNQAVNGGGAYTAGGQFIMARSAVRSSFISNEGGGIFIASQAMIVNSTFSNNRALKGGALFSMGNVAIHNTTFNENRADTAGAIWQEATYKTSIKNSILGGSLDTNGGNPSLNCDGPTLTSQGHNIVSDNSCVPNPSTVGDKLGTNPQLGPWLGTPVRAYIPNAGSPAVDYGFDCPPEDQRGYPRPIGAACDVGSIERGELLFLPLAIR
jgi:hypothetical protein